MTQKQKKDIIKKKKIIVITGLIFLLFVISAILAVTIFYFQSKNNELANQNSNILYYNEEQNEIKEENEVLIVGLDEENTDENEADNPNEKADNEGEKPKKVDSPYYIKVNNQANVVTIYKKDSKGKYETPVKAMVCSIGDATPEKGVYTMSDKYTWRLLQGNVYGQYACRITGHILFHSVPYESQDKSTLEWWEYDKLGTKASLGCIRLKVEDAKWIYDNCIAGTQVEFYSSSNPGPLGKPTAQKISNDEEVRNWDPTDPDNNNPWKEYLKRKQEEKKSSTKNEEKDTNKNNNINTNTNTVNTTNTNTIDKEASTKIENTVTNKISKTNEI